MLANQDQNMSRICIRHCSW